MLVLLSFALVLVATVLLVLGLLSDDGLLLIYLSIGSSVLAAVVLLVALRVNRPRQEVAAGRPAPLPDPEPAREPALVGAAPGTVDETAVAPVAPVAASAAPSGGAEWQAVDQDTWSADDGWDEEVDFPIADYDTLTTGQILPLLPQLYADEIDVVEERERATKGRAEILAKLAQLRSAGEAGSEDPLASYTEPADSQPAPTPADDPWFPIEDYESLSAAQIRPLLRELDGEELAMVRSRELSLGRRQTLLDEIDHLAGHAGEPSPSEAPASGEATAAPTARTAASAAPAKRAAAKRVPTTAATTGATAKKPAASKATVARKATPAKASPATKKAAATKKASPAKQAAAKKATAAKKAAPATKAAAAKKATPAKKTAAAAKKTTAAAKKTATKKATPAKKSAAKRSGR